jgi:hypothetical protein
LEELLSSNIILFHIVNKDSAKINHFFKEEDIMRHYFKSHVRKAGNKLEGLLLLFPEQKVTVWRIHSISDYKTEMPCERSVLRQQ